MAVDRELVEAVADELSLCRSVLFVTGAGISADSGLPTYRGIGGLYEEKATEDGIPIEVALSGAMFARDPDVTWRHIHRIESSCRGVYPNAAHRAIVAMERHFSQIRTLTQNVDGLHDRAGSAELVEIHGNLYELICTQCARVFRVESYATLQVPPRCEVCAGLVRPQVVLFGEMLPERATLTLMEWMRDGFHAVFSIGTTSVFPYIAEPIHRARQQGALSVEINPGSTEVSHSVKYRLKSGAAETMQALQEALHQRRGVQ